MRSLRTTWFTYKSCITWCYAQFGFTDLILFSFLFFFFLSQFGCYVTGGAADFILPSTYQFHHIRNRLNNSVHINISTSSWASNERIAPTVDWLVLIKRKKDLLNVSLEFQGPGMPLGGFTLPGATATGLGPAAMRLSGQPSSGSVLLVSNLNEEVHLICLYFLWRNGYFFFVSFFFFFLFVLFYFLSLLLLILLLLLSLLFLCFDGRILDSFHSLYLLTLFVDLFCFIHFLYQTKKNHYHYSRFIY